jgi:hypothetical protein
MSGATDVSAGPGAQISPAAAANPVDVAIRLRARKLEPIQGCVNRIVYAFWTEVRFGSILSKKSFGGNKRNFPELLMRLGRSDVRDHFASQKSDHGPSYRRY